jgi:hypothetical protein
MHDIFIFLANLLFGVFFNKINILLIMILNWFRKKCSESIIIGMWYQFKEVIRQTLLDLNSFQLFKDINI